MVVAGASIDQKDEHKLKELGVKDSKLLSSSVREELFDQIRDIVEDFRIEVIEPDAIDLSLTEVESNLNWLEAETSARLVSELDPDKIIIDCPSINLQAYKDYFANKLSEAVKNKAELIVEHKADLNYIVVAAASVIAKVIRDRQVDKIKSEIGVDFGSGYMSDKKTQIFLEKYHDKHPELFRRKWKSYTNILEKKQQSRLGDF